MTILLYTAFRLCKKYLPYLLLWLFGLVGHTFWISGYSWLCVSWDNYWSDHGTLLMFVLGVSYSCVLFERQVLYKSITASAFILKLFLILLRSNWFNEISEERRASFDIMFPFILILLNWFYLKVTLKSN